MPYKKQHLVPKCYLDSFVDYIPPKGVLPSKYKPAIWIVEKSLREQPKQRGSSNALWKSYYYNLDNDDPNRPKVENFLSKVEGRFSIVLQKIKKHERLDLQDKIDLALFIDTFFRRTEGQIDHFQKQFDELESLYRHADRVCSGNENASDKYFIGSHELAKKMVSEATGTITQLVLQAGFSIVVNKSDMPFFTSDSPVTYIFQHIDDLYRRGVPKRWTYDNIGTNENMFFCYCPLTPHYAFISSPFIRSLDKDIYRFTEDLSFVVGMNFITHQHADSVLISSKPRPYVHYQERAILEYEKTRNSCRPEGQGLRIYTNRARYDIAVSKYELINENSLLSKLKFWTHETEAIRSMANDQRVDQVLYFNSGKESGGMRNLIFSLVSIHPDAPSVLQTNW